MLQISLFGGMLLRAAGDEVVSVSGQKVRALLGYLAACLDAPSSRAKVAGLLWGDRGERQARDSLKQAIWYLRRTLAPAGAALILADRQSVWLDAARVTVDVVEFAKMLNERSGKSTDRAAELYRGEFLDGVDVPGAAFEEWLLMERQRLRQLATEALSASLAGAFAACQRERAATLARQLMGLDPHNEGACRALMQIHADRGERSQALTSYETLRRRLARDLDVRPEPSTIALYEAIRRQRGEAPGAATAFALGASGSGQSAEGAAGFSPSDELADDLATRPSIAVLSFCNIGDDPEQDYFAEGLTEDLITDLSQLSGLLTVVHHGSRSAQERLSAQEAARRLRTRYALDGRVRKVGSRVRVTAQLIEGATACCIWAGRYDRDVSDIFVLQEELSKGIAEALRVKLLPGEVEQLTGRPTASIEAYQLYLLGRSFYLRGYDKKCLRIARDLFAKASELDPRYAHALAARATCDANLCGNDPTVTFEAVVATSERAVALAPELGEAHAAMGLAHYIRGRYPAAMDCFERAMALDPALFEAHFFKARCCRMLGQREPCLALFESAAELRPHDYRCAGLLAEEYQALGLLPEFRSSALRSLQHVTQEVKSHPDNADAWAFGSALLVELGESLRGEEWARRAVVIGPDDYLVHYNAARTYALLGKFDLALQWLERALTAPPVFRRRLLAWMPLDQALDPLRGRDAFSALTAAAGAQPS